MKHCTKCGEEIEEGAEYCSECGQPVKKKQTVAKGEQTQATTRPTQTMNPGMLVLGAIFAIAGLLVLSGAIPLFTHTLDVGGVVIWTYVTEEDRMLNAIVGIIGLVMGGVLLLGARRS